MFNIVRLDADNDLEYFKHEGKGRGRFYPDSRRATEFVTEAEANDVVKSCGLHLYKTTSVVPVPTDEELAKFQNDMEAWARANPGAVARAEREEESRKRKAAGFKD